MPVPLANPSAAQNRLAGSTQASRAPFDAPAPLRLWHLTSLDAPTVAVVWSLSFAWVVGVHLPKWVPVLLAIGTWVAYVGDRLLIISKLVKLHRRQVVTNFQGFVNKTMVIHGDIIGVPLHNKREE